MKADYKGVDEYFFKQGDSVSKFYFIKEGEA